VTFPLYIESKQIYNLACPRPSPIALTTPIRCRPRKTSVHGAINMARACQRVGARILQASTSEVYGDPSRPPEEGGILGQCKTPTVSALLPTRAARVPEELFFGLPTAQHKPSKSRFCAFFNTYRSLARHPNDGVWSRIFIVQALRGRATSPSSAMANRAAASGYRGRSGARDAADDGHAGFRNWAHQCPGNPDC